MNKLFTKIAGAVLGLTLTIGVGLGAGQHEPQAVHAASDDCYEQVQFSDANGENVLIVAKTSSVSYFVLGAINGTSAAPTAISVKVENDLLSAETDLEQHLWTVEISSSSYTFKKANDASKWLYCTSLNNGVRVGTNDNKAFTLDSSGYFKNTATSRYLGVYNSQDWRCYINTTGNTANQTFSFWKKSSATISKYDVTYVAGSNGSGENYVHSSQAEGSYTLLNFNSLGFVPADGYVFDSYNVAGTTYNPGDTIQLTGETTVIVNFKIKPLNTTYDFVANFSTYASDWGNSYATHSGIDGETDLNGFYGATIELSYASKQSAGSTIDVMPVINVKTDTDSYVKVLTFELTETDYLIDEIKVTFEQWSTRTPQLALFKGNTVSGTELALITIGTDSELIVDNFGDTEFSVGYMDSSTSSRQVGIKSIYISLIEDTSVTTFDKFEITNEPSKTTFNEGDAFDVTGLEVNATFTVDGVEEVTTFSGENLSELSYKIDGVSIAINENINAGTGTKTVTVSYTDSDTETTLSDTYTITISAYVGVSFSKVSSNLEDWRGTYLIAYESGTEVKVLDGNLDQLDAVNNYLSETVTNETITVNSDNANIERAAFEVGKTTDGYYIKSSKGLYIYSTSFANKLQNSTNVDSVFFNWDSENNRLLINGNTTSDGATTLCYNTTSGQTRFRFMKTPSEVYVPVVLYKLNDNGYVAEADAYGANFTSTVGGVCDPNGVSNNTTTLWSAQKTAFAELSVDAQGHLARATANETGTAFEKAVALYDYIVGKYGVASNEDFMSRTESGKLVLSTKTPMIIENNNIATLIIVVASSMTLIAGVIVFKRKKSQLSK